MMQWWRCFGNKRVGNGTLPAVLMMLALAGVTGTDLSAQSIFAPNASDGTISEVDTNQGRELWQLQVSEATENRPTPRVMLVGGQPESSRPAERGAGRSSSVPSASVVPINDPYRALALANNWKTRFPAVTTYVTSEKIRFMFPDQSIVDVPMPEDTMMVAAAPYVVNTHPCTVHTMSGCQGELRNEPVEVTVYDEHDRIFLQTSAQSLENGFVELWLPRDQRFRIRFEARGMSVERPIETFDGSPTCITDLRL